MSAELEAFVSHQDNMERDRQAQAAALEVAKETTKQIRMQARDSTKEMITWIFGFIFAGAVILGISYMIWQGTQGPNSDQIMYDKGRSQCIEKDGSFVNGDCILGRE